MKTTEQSPAAPATSAAPAEPIRQLWTDREAYAAGWRPVYGPKKTWWYPPKTK